MVRACDPNGEGAASSDAPGWCLYLIECSNGAWYAGITNDLARRYAAHASGRGARYTRANPPRRLIGARAYPDRASASRAEWQIKQLPRAQKLEFLQPQHPDPEQAGRIDAPGPV